MEENIQHIKNIKKVYEKKWLKMKDVTGIGIGLTGSKKMGIIVSVSNESKKVKSAIPSEIEGVPVEIKQTGRFFAQDK